VSSTNASEEAAPFLAREDSTANIARDLDLPKDPEPSLIRRTCAPAVNEAGASNWQDALELLFPQVKIEEHLYFGQDETENIVQSLEQTDFEKAEKKKKKNNKKVVRTNPHGSSLCTERSLSHLKARFEFGDEVTLRVPSPDERTDSPPEGFFTLYKGFFYLCFLWLSIPRLVLEYATAYQIALS